MVTPTGFDPAPSDCTACFSVVAAAEPGVMPRILELFAKRGLVPSQWFSTRTGHDRRGLHIDFQVENMEAPLRDQIAACLRQIVEVETVLTSEKRRALSA